MTPGEAKADPQRGVELEAPALWLDLWPGEGQRALKEESGEGGGQAIESLQSQERAKTVWDGRGFVVIPRSCLRLCSLSCSSRWALGSLGKPKRPWVPAMGSR